jgi:hypothetical protein
MGLNVVSAPLAFGILLIMMGVVSILWGDRKMPGRSGIITRIFARPQSAKWGKWLIGGALLLGGVMTISKVI